MRKRSKVLAVLLTVIVALVPLSVIAYNFFYQFEGGVTVSAHGIDVFDVDDITQLTQIQFGNVDSSMYQNNIAEIDLPESGYYNLTSLDQSANYSISWSVSDTVYTWTPHTNGKHMEVRQDGKVMLTLCMLSPQSPVTGQYFGLGTLEAPNLILEPLTSADFKVRLTVWESCDADTFDFTISIYATVL